MNKLHITLKSYSKPCSLHLMMTYVYILCVDCHKRVFLRIRYGCIDHYSAAVVRWNSCRSCHEICRQYTERIRDVGCHRHFVRGVGLLVRSHLVPTVYHRHISCDALDISLCPFCPAAYCGQVESHSQRG